ncbi:hypothetical protein E4K72_08050 [Oxalobacteraceae bacterium OM1]|nr:hypothetical protein E4K72_08050 [Oxalobacteraceae bacterium OM1]
MDIQDRQDCERNIRRVTQLIDSGIFNPDNGGHPLQQSAFIDLMICMRDLMHKTEKYTKRVDFVDDVLTNNYVIRDACCHIDSFKKDFDGNGNRGEYIVAYGKCNLMKMDDFEAKGEYEDDVAIFYGRNRVYMRRHILRAFHQAQAQLQPLLARR